MSLPRIVVFTDWFFPGFKAGGPIQSCRNFAAALKNDYSIFIITGDRDLGDNRPYSNIQVNEWNAYDTNVQVFYADNSRLNLGSIKQLLDEIQPAYVYLNSMYSLKFTIFPLWLLYKNRTNAKFVLAPRGMLQQGAMQFKSKKKKFFISLLRFSGITKKILFQATDTQEEQDIKQFFPAARIIIAGNFPKMEQVAWKQVDKKQGELKAVFVSRVAPKKNLLFLLTLLKELPASLQLSLDIWGEPEDEAYLQQCKQAVASLSKNTTVNWKGAIPNDVLVTTLQDYHLFILPTFGENFGHAIFEALLAGKPVLISDKTPWRNLQNRKAGYDIPLSQPAAYLDALRHFGDMQQQEYDEWSLAATEIAKSIQHDKNLLAQYKAIFN